MALVKVKLRNRAAGPWGSAEPGTIIEVPAAVAKMLVASHQADPVDGGPSFETAVAPEVEVSSKAKRPSKAAASLEE